MSDIQREMRKELITAFAVSVPVALLLGVVAWAIIKWLMRGCVICQ